MATAVLTSIKACVAEFKPEELTDSGKNLDRRWKEWLENFELVLDFEGVTDPTEGKSRKKAALLTVGGQPLREIFSTLTRGRGHVQGCKRSPLSTLFTQEEFDGGTIPIFLHKAYLPRGNS